MLYSLLVSLLISPLLSLVIATKAQANGGKRPDTAGQPPMGVIRRVVRLKAFPDRYIELPSSVATGQETRGYGRNIYEALRVALDQDGRFLVISDLAGGGQERQGLEFQIQPSTTVPADPVIVPVNPEATTEVDGRVVELSFQTGERAERSYYGFRPGYETAFNGSGTGQSLNEFHSITGEPSSFAKTFDDSGDLHLGVDLASHLNFDVLWVGASLKWAHYLARMGVEVTYRHQLMASTQVKTVTAQGQGFFFTLSAQYQGVTGELVLARRAAMLDAFNHTVTGLVNAMKEEMARQPVAVTLAGPGPRGEIYVTAGAINYNMGVGQRFYSRSAWERGQEPAVFTTEKVYQTISSVKVVNQGGAYALGDRLISLNAAENPPPLPAAGMASSSLAAVERTSLTTNLADRNLEMAPSLQRYEENPVVRFFKGLAELIMLPFRIARFLQYDQDFAGGEMWQADAARARTLASAHWSLQSIGASEAWRETMGSNAVVVAVLDTGVDYNHQDLRRNIFWDGRQESPGYDFFSDDPRPYDDHAHGTAVAGAVAGGGWQIMGAAPRATILPVKVFSPYGETSSAALAAGFQYAIAQGAKVILCGWATSHNAQSIRDAVGLAQANGVLVVAAAGDQGVDLEHDPRYPATLSETFDNVITVAGYDETGALTRESGELRLSSNYGAAVTLAAPGGNVWSASPRNGYGASSYSGVAAGFVAGGAALLWAACPRASYPVIAMALKEGAQSLAALRGEVPGNKALSLPGALRALKTHCN